MEEVRVDLKPDVLGKVDMVWESEAARSVRSSCHSDRFAYSGSVVRK